MVGNKHSFFSAIFSDNFKSIIAYTYNGAFYLWKCNNSEKKISSQPIIHGHFGPVSDLDWDPSNNYLVTTSEDQTARIYANWVKNDTWHEINRPQIHGYDMNTIKFLSDDPTGNYLCRLVSGADEKVIRIFSPPFNLVNFLNNLSNIKINFSKEHDNKYYEKCKIILIY
jgi:elongator complex protein 2